MHSPDFFVPLFLEQLPPLFDGQALILLLPFFPMKGGVYGITAFPVRESECQAFHSINETVRDMVVHLADTFDSNATLLKGCIIFRRYSPDASGDLHVKSALFGKI